MEGVIKVTTFASVKPKQLDTMSMILIHKREQYRKQCLEYIYKTRGLTDTVLRLPKPYDDYSVDIENGCVFSHKTDKWLKGYITENGYTTFCLSVNGKNQKHFIHRLIAYAIVGRVFDKGESVILHRDEGFGLDKDGNTRVNNHYTNLKLGTQKENSNARQHRKRCKDSSHKKPVVMCERYTNNHIRRFESATEAAHYLNVIDNSNISMCCNHKMKSTNGYSWFYADEYEKIKDTPITITDNTNRKKPVVMCEQHTNKCIKTFNSITEAAKHLNRNHQGISKCCNHKKKSAYGYSWYFEEEYNKLTKGIAI